MFGLNISGLEFNTKKEDCIINSEPAKCYENYRFSTFGLDIEYFI
jgi:hypothetical protein